jgi:hypothetical protein
MRRRERMAGVRTVVSSAAMVYYEVLLELISGSGFGFGDRAEASPVGMDSGVMMIRGLGARCWLSADWGFS